MARKEIIDWTPADVRRLMMHAKLTQAQLGERLGTSQQQISVYASGKKRISNAYCQLLSLLAKEVDFIH